MYDPIVISLDDNVKFYWIWIGKEGLDERKRDKTSSHKSSILGLIRRTKKRNLTKNSVYIFSFQC